MVVSRLIIKIFIYSDIKISANIELLYSVLYPDTSSDSPSDRSNGVRLVSARLVINHKRNIGERRIMIHDFMFIFIKFIFIEC